jgi:subtilisin-like proprotein convertase family protein
MSSRRFIWLVPCLLLLLAGVWLLWRLESRPAGKSAAPTGFSYTAPRPVLPGQLPAGNQSVPARVRAALATNAFALRLSNTPNSIGELVNDPHAILLENALIDTRRPLDFSIPKHLQAQGDPGAYIVQSRGPITAAFRAKLSQAGAEIISYIPNDAYLVRVTAGGASGLADSPLTQSVIPYEPYYKIQSSLLNAAVGQKPLPDGAVLNLGLLAGNAAQTISQIEKLGGRILAQDRSPFGPVLRVQPPANWTALAALPGVQIVEPFHPRVHANDLSRVQTGVSTDTVTNTTYLGLSGSNVIVQVNDSGIDATHPDFTTGGSAAGGAGSGGPPIRVIGLTANDLVDTDGHGTFVAGEIAGNGAASINPTPVGAVLGSMNFGSVTNADFRGKAPLATLFAMSYGNSEQSMQEEAALTNALISNNSWNNDGDNTYSLDAASYDAATRDALPEVTGSQPVLFVFSAGNAGNGDDSSDPGGGDSDSIQSPATAKNVITVGAIQEERNITNYVTNADGTIGQPWLPETSTSYRIAGFSSRGNVGIGIEGTYGRVKPDVVAPGTFIVSTRSIEWAVTNYFYQDPTNYDIQFFPGVVSDPDSLWVNGFPTVPNDAISVNITVSPNADSPNPFPTNPIYFAMFGSPFPGSTPPTPSPNQVNIPSDGGFQISDILNSETYYGFNYGISNTTSSPMSFDLTTIIVTTNSLDNHLLVLSNLDNAIGPYYRFETGTSMSAADVSGVLALMEDFFTNTLQTTPSPALLKAMLINGARPTGAYNLQANNTINYEGWGLVNLPNSLPTNNPAYFNGTVPSSIYIQDQSPTNALATGDNHTFGVTILTNAATLRVTLAWTDPPGDPVAAIKLVNSLELVVTNMDNPTNPVVYYGNDIPAGGVFNTPETASNSVSVDVINNVQNIILQQPLGTNYSVAVIGREVNVNAVSAQTNIYAGPPNSSGVLAPNTVQDYALVISSGNASAPGSFTVADQGIVSNPTGDQDMTFVATTNQPLMNQFAGANTPLLGTNTVDYGSSNELVTLGMTNQWHFYVVTNNALDALGSSSDVTNAGFVTFSPDTLSIPRMGVFAGSQANATTPQADIDLYVTTDSNLMILSPLTISNCANGTQIGASIQPPGIFNGASLSRGGTEYVVDSNSAPGEVYYIGVKSERQVASEYEFIPIFTSVPFSQIDSNGVETVNGEPVPVNIPDGTPADPGVMNWVMGIALYPITVKDITATTEITHQNFGDLYGTLTHNDSGTGAATVDVLNNHDAWGSVVDQYFIYNETNVSSGTTPPADIYGPSDGPGSLKNFFGQDGSGVWQLSEVDDSFTQTGSVQNFTMVIQPYQPLTGGVTNTIPPHGVFTDFVDVPAGATNLTINATNITPAPDTLNPLLMTIKFGSEPTLANADKGPVGLTNGIPPGNSLSVGPTDVPPIQPGRYYIDITNQSDTAQTVFVMAVILPANPGAATTDFTSTNSTALIDDAVTYSDIFVTNTEPIVSLNVGIVVQHPRISDLVFHLISPDGTRVLLMENRGGDTPDGAGISVVETNVITTTNTVSVTNSLATATAGDYTTGQTVAGWTVGTNQVSMVTDPANAYQGGNLLALANGSVSTTLSTVAGQTYSATFAYRGPGIVAWWRGESNALDSISGISGTFLGSPNYTNGAVGTALSFNGVNNGVRFPASASLNVGVGNGMTIEAWVNPSLITQLNPVVEWNTGSGINYGTHFWLSHYNFPPGNFFANLVDTAGNWHVIQSPAGSIVPKVYQHVAVTYNKTSGNAALFCQGLPVTITYLGSFTLQTSYDVYLGERPPGSADSAVFTGGEDEISIYNRPLSDSEIKAIYQKGAAGKFDPTVFNTSPAQSLAEAQIGVTGQSTATFSGNNSNWQTYTATFTATTNHTTLSLAGVEPGMLLGPLVTTSPVLVTNVVTNIYYLTFTEDTNLTTTPIKFAPPPFVPAVTMPTNIFTDSFEQTSAGAYTSGSMFGNGWAVTSNQVSVVTDPTNAYDGSNYLALASGTILTNLPTVAGNTYTLTFAYRGPGITAWWRAESNTVDSINGNNGALKANYATAWYNGFEDSSSPNTTAGNHFAGGWLVNFGSIDLVANGYSGSTAYQGNYYIDLDGSAPGEISTNISTIAGATYTLNFAYTENPNAATTPKVAVKINGITRKTVTANIVNSWASLNWQTTSVVFTASSSSTFLVFDSLDPSGDISGVLLDAVSLTTNVINGAVTYTNGEVGSAFNLPGVDPNQVSTHFSVGPGPEVQVPYSSLWNFGSNNFTIDLWANFNVVPSNLGYGIGYPYDGILISDDAGFGGNKKWWFAQDGPVLDFHINDPSSFGADFTVQAPFTPQPNQWYHYAVTRNGNLFTIYANGAAIGSQTDSNVIPNPNVPLEIGGAEGFYFNGSLDETSIYGRALSASEINAIYNAGNAGKFDPTVFNTSPAQSLAEARVSLNGQTQAILQGSNTTWQTETITFTATQDGTPLSITGLEPGMLLDDFVLTAVPGNIYYQPEQSLDAFTGLNPYGDWQLEIQDDRAGAGLTNTLVSWELQFVFANTNAVPLVLGGGIGQSNQFIPAGDIAWYQINVPANANFATNLLLFASAPVNVWFSTNVPPTIINPGDTNLIPNLTAASVLLSITNPPDLNVQSPPNIYDGETYYLGVQNTNSFTVNYGIKVNFDLAGQFSSLVLSSVTASGNGASMNWTAAPTAQFQMQWKDDLTQPWNTDPTVITSSDGNFNFTDDGSQTAPLGVMRFYRLVRISP